MGFNIEWVAATDISEADFADRLGLEIGDVRDVGSGPAITTVGEWTLVYSSYPTLMTDEQKLELSQDRKVVVHQSVDSVMYAFTNELEGGEVVRSATVNLDQLDEEDIVSTVGHTDSLRKKLERLNRKSGPSAYDEVAEIARRLVGFRHDATRMPVFRALIDNAPKPATVEDRMLAWLQREGFKESRSRAGHGPNYVRQVDDDFFLGVWLRNDKMSVGIGHAGLWTFHAETFGHTGSSDEPMWQAYFGSTGRPNSSQQPDASDDSVVAPCIELIERAQAHCSLQEMAFRSGPKVAVSIELLRGWSTRGESLIKQLKVLDTDQRVMDQIEFVLDEAAPLAEAVGELRSEKAITVLEEALARGERLSPIEIATLQDHRGAREDLLFTLQFGHWALALVDPNLDEDVAVHIVNHQIRHKEPRADLRKVISKMTLTTGIELALISRSLDALHDVAVHPELSAESQIRLAQDSDSHSIGGNPNLVPEAQRLLIDNAPNPHRLTSLAGNPSVLPELMTVLASSKTYEVRAALARNPSTPPQLVEKLSRDRKRDVKQAASFNPMLPESRQVEIAQMEDSLGLGLNKGVCAQAQRLLVENGHTAHLPRNPALVEELFPILARSSEPKVRSALARNDNLPPEIELELSKDPVDYVRSSIASRPRLDESLRAILKEDESAMVRKSATRFGPLRREDGQWWTDPY